MTNLSDRIVVLTLSETPAPRLDKALAEVAPPQAGLSRSRLGKLIAEGHVSTADGQPVTSPKVKTTAGAVYHVDVPISDEELAVAAQDLPLSVIYEDEHLIVVDKAADMVVHPAPGSPDGTLVNALLHHCGDNLQGVGGEKRPGIVHRIDKGTSGLLVVAKSDTAHTGLASQFADHSIKRIYQALVIGVPSKSDPRLGGIAGVAFEDGGIIRIGTNIARHKTDRKRMAVVQNAGRHAITRICVKERFGAGAHPRASLVECQLETGRTHQIRVHMSHIGHGLIGDPIYGRRRKLAVSGLSEEHAAFVNGFTRQCLHAQSLGFIHPISKDPLHFSVDMPEDMRTMSEILRSFD